MSNSTQLCGLLLGYSNVIKIYENTMKVGKLHSIIYVVSKDKERLIFFCN